MTKVVLTRYLYHLDEVVLSLQQALLSKTSFDEVVFWVSEIFYSRFITELWDQVFKVYYNFYAIVYPKYEKKLNMLFMKSATDIENILSAYNILYYSKPNIEVFKVDVLQPTTPKKIYLKIPEWLSKMNVPKKYNQLLLSIHKKQLINIAYYLHVHKDYSEVYDLIVCYFKDIRGMELGKLKIHDMNHNDKRRICLALIMYLYNDASNINKRAIFRRYIHNHYKKEIDDSNILTQPIYKTLLNKRKYSISDKLGCFNLARYYSDIPINKILWYHWEYYAYRTPLWKERFDKYNIIVDHKNHTINFVDENEEEEFYEQYNYEPDEQSLEIQMRSIREIPQIGFNSWCKYIKN